MSRSYYNSTLLLERFQVSLNGAGEDGEFRSESMCVYIILNGYGGREGEEGGQEQIEPHGRSECDGDQ
jgi:hypothetical protein